MARCSQVVRDSDDPWSSAPGIGSAFIRSAIEECPYYKYHRVPKEKMLKHMMKCRKAYIQKCKQEGEIPLTLTCKYNIEHVVYAPEIMYHEERCTDADFVPTYLLNTEPFKDCPRYDPLFATLQPTQAELDKLYEGCYLDTFIGADSFGIPVPFSELEKFNATYQYLDEWFDISPEECQEEEEAATSASVEEERVKAVADAGAAGGVDNDRNATPTPGPSSKWSASASVVREDEGSEEEEFWESDANEPNFSYIQNIYNPKKPLFIYPPGLNKRERAEYVKFNTKWVNDLGIRKIVQVTGINDDTEDEEETFAIATATELSLVAQQKRTQVKEVDVAKEEVHQDGEDDDEEEVYSELNDGPMNYELEKEKFDFVEWNMLNLFWIMIIEEVHKC